MIANKYYECTLNCGINKIEDRKLVTCLGKIREFRRSDFEMFYSVSESESLSGLNIFLNGDR